LPSSLQQNQKQEGNGSLLLSLSSLQQNQKEEGDNNSYYRLLHCNRTKKEGRELTFKHSQTLTMVAPTSNTLEL